jgi:hypothetical protein
MVDIECTRCHAKGKGYQTNYEAKFSLIHKEKCGAKIGVPKFSAGVKTTAAETTTITEEKPIIVSSILSDTHKPKKKKAKKKADL